MTNPSAPCMHGFPAQQCVSCRTCEHGQTTAACARCNQPRRTTKVAPPSGDQTAHEHAGYEIYYEAAVSGWRYRGPDAVASPQSYRSAFLARKAADDHAGAEATVPPARGRKGRKS